MSSSIAIKVLDKIYCVSKRCWSVVRRNLKTPDAKFLKSRQLLAGRPAIGAQWPVNRNNASRRVSLTGIFERKSGLEASAECQRIPCLIPGPYDCDLLLDMHAGL